MKHFLKGSLVIATVMSPTDWSEEIQIIGTFIDYAPLNPTFHVAKDIFTVRAKLRECDPIFDDPVYNPPKDRPWPTCVYVYNQQARETQRLWFLQEDVEDKTITFTE